MVEVVAGQKNIEKVVPDHPMFAALDSEPAAVIEMDDVRTPFGFQERLSNSFGSHGPVS